MPSRSIHAIANGGVSSILWLHDVPVCVCVCVCTHTTSSLSIIHWWTPVGSTSRLLYTGCNEHGGWWGSFLERVTSFPSDKHRQTSPYCASESLCFLQTAGLRQPRFGGHSLGAVFHPHLCAVCLYYVLGMLAISKLFILIILIMVTAIGDLWCDYYNHLGIFLAIKYF